MCNCHQHRGTAVLEKNLSFYCPCLFGNKSHCSASELNMLKHCNAPLRRFAASRAHVFIAPCVSNVQYKLASCNSVSSMFVKGFASFFGERMFRIKRLALRSRNSPTRLRGRAFSLFSCIRVKMVIVTCAVFRR